jgi:MFS family permease
VDPPAALRQPAFRSLWLAGLISDAGDWMLLIALPIVVYRLTGSALGTSGAFLAELGPGVVLGPWAGRLADTIDRRQLMLAVSVLQALALLPLLLVHDRAGLPLLYAVIVVQAALAALFDPAKNALLPTLLKPAQIVRANSLIALNQGFGRLAGGPLGGLLLAAGDLRTIVIADAASFLLAAVLLARLPPSPRRSAGPRRSSGPRRSPGPSLSRRGPAVDSPQVVPRWRALRSRTVRAPLTRTVRAGLAVAFVAQIAQGIFVVLFIVFVARRLHGDSSEIGLLRGVQAVGAIAAGLGITMLARDHSPGSLVAGAALLFGVVDLTIWNAPALTTTTAVYIALFIAAGAPGVAMQTGLVSLVALAAPAGARGRAFGALGMAGNAGQAIGMVAAGALTSQLGLMTMLNAQGALYIAAGVLAALGLAAAPPRRTRRPALSGNLARWWNSS